MGQVCGVSSLQAGIRGVTCGRRQSESGARLELRRALGVLLDVVGVWVLVDDEIVDLVDDDDRVAEDL